MKHPRQWVLLRAEYERLLELMRLMRAGNVSRGRRKAVAGLLAIVEAQLAVELKRAAE